MNRWTRGIVVGVCVFAILGAWAETTCVRGGQFKDLIQPLPVVGELAISERSRRVPRWHKVDDTNQAVVFDLDGGFTEQVRCNWGQVIGAPVHQTGLLADGEHMLKLVKPQAESTGEVTIDAFGYQGPLEHTKMNVPRIAGEYVNVYRPAGDVFPGPSVGSLIAGEYYDEWVPNDHCIVKDQAGYWHAFGITHPRTDLEDVHLGEHQSFHAIAPMGSLKEVLREASWKDLPKVLPPAERPGEIPANHAPYILTRNDLFHMVYGPSPIRYAVSTDLSKWTPMGALGNTPVGRDPSILFLDGTYHLITCGEQDVRIATSTDFEVWEQHKPILTMKKGVDPESPSIVHHNDRFYLFVCGWNGEWDRKSIQGAYQHTTYVYQSDDLFAFDLKDEVTRLNAHAPEIFQDEDGDWYISSVEWPYRGMSIARLVWE